MASIHTHALESEADRKSKQFFNISQAEAHAIDPQQRILLEVTYQALENGKSAPQLRDNSLLIVRAAGYSKESLDLSETTVNVGTFVKGKPDPLNISLRPSSEANSF